MKCVVEKLIKVVSLMKCVVKMNLMKKLVLENGVQLGHNLEISCYEDFVI